MAPRNKKKPQVSKRPSWAKPKASVPEIPSIPVEVEPIVGPARIIISEYGRVRLKLQLSNSTIPTFYVSSGREINLEVTPTTLNAQALLELAASIVQLAQATSNPEAQQRWARVPTSK
jgi:hypothetical protein